MEKAVINYDDFKIFFNENKSKLYMTPETGSGTHPVLRENIERWIQKIRDLEHYSDEERLTLLKFSELVEHYLRYVTFDEFFSVIQKMAVEMFELIKDKDRVIFILDDEPNKSNTWVSLLCFGELEKMGLEKYKDKLICICAEHDKTIYTELNNTVAFFFDDMIYSGTQSGGIAELFNTYAEKNNFQGYFVVPFASVFAYNNVLTKQGKFLKGVKVVDTIKTIMDRHFKDEPDTIKNITTMCLMEGDAREIAVKQGVQFNVKNYKGYERSREGIACKGLNNGQTLIYFDHKIADYISVLTNVESHGQYPINIKLENYVNKAEKRGRIVFPEAGSLIANCDETNRDIYCYPTFYKTYTYTYKGKNLNSEYVPTIQQMSSVNLSVGGRRKKYTHKKRKTSKRTRRR